jgi:HlyD family secretion protein
MAVSTTRRQPLQFFRHRPWLTLLLVGGLGFGGWNLLKPKPQPKPAPSIVQMVTAQGRLIPEGGLVNLSIPAGTAGGNEVVQRWLVREGSSIRKGELLAELSSYPQLKAALDQAEANLKATRSLLPFLIISRDKGEELFSEGAVSEEEYGKAVATVTSRKADIAGSEAAAQEARLKLAAAQIRSPLDGTLIRIYSWPGMKETSDGLALIGRTGRMQVWAQVFQSDVAKIRPGQTATIKPETGDFLKTMSGTVDSIIGNVSERDLFATNANNDVNARVVLVKLDIAPQYQAQVARLSGMNVTVRFDQ